MDTNKWLALSHITGGLNIADEMAKTTTQTKLIMVYARSVPQTIRGENRDVISKSYPDDQQFLAYPETQKCQKYLNTFARHVAGLGKWQIIEKVALLPICCIIEDQKRNK